MPADAFPDFVGLMHHQRFGDVMAQVTGVFHVPVAATFHSLAGQAQHGSPGFRIYRAARIPGPVRVDRVTRVTLQSAFDGPHRRVQVLHTRQVLKAVDVQRQPNDRQLGVLAALPALALVLPAEPARRHSVGGGCRIKQTRAHVLSHLL
ncbi:hypothetical protein [Streptomyces sp. NPDC101149]|uniref:hypothetical protein n=1 Tax=Streptomyces sp. NPDC101149 TaxID=3366113 RepID=UPI00381036B3